MTTEAPPKSKYALDVLVISHNHIELTISCLQTLYRHTRLPFHLIVIDDSTDLTPMWLAQFSQEHDNMTYVHSTEPYKTGNQIFNIGFNHCETPYMATVMNSIKVEPDWEMGGLQAMQMDPKIGVIGFKCLLPNGHIESAGIHMNKYLPCDVGRDQSGNRFSFTHESDAVQWAFALVRVEAARGQLEENCFHGFRGWDDIDNCFVLRKGGWRILYCGASSGYHEPRATRGNDGPEAAQQNKENGEKFYKRWGLWEKFLEDHPDGKDIHAMPKGLVAAR